MSEQENLILIDSLKVCAQASKDYTDKKTEDINNIKNTIAGYRSSNSRTSEIFNQYSANNTNKIDKNPITDKYPSSAHVEGSNNTATGNSSHAEGDQTIANGDCSHTEGLGGQANGYASHVQNSRNEAYGYGSSANGYYTKAYGAGNFVIGMYNEVDDKNKNTETQSSWPSGGPIADKNRGTNAFTIGNGTSETDRRNAFTVDWNGNVKASGNISGKVISGNTVSATNASIIGNLYVDGTITLEGNTDIKSTGENLPTYRETLTAVKALQANPVGHNIKVIKPNAAGSIILQENTYYQFLGSSTKKKLHFYNTDNSIGKTLEFQVLTIYCGSMTDMAEIGIVENMSPAYLMVIGNDTGLNALTGAEVGTYAFKKYLPNSTEINPTFRAEVEYPADSVIVVQTCQSIFN